MPIFNNKSKSWYVDSSKENKTLILEAIHIKGITTPGIHIGNFPLCSSLTNFTSQCYKYEGEIPTQSWI